MERKSYRVTEAAQATDVPEQELLTAIRDGLLRARLMQNTGEWHIDADDLARYVRRTRHADPFGFQKKRKILLLGEDLLLAGTLKLELQRDPRTDVRYASWGKDAILMVDHYNADLVVVDLSPSQVAPDEVLAAVSGRRRSGKGAVVAYYTRVREGAELPPMIRARLDSLKPDGEVSMSRGIRGLVAACMAALGLEPGTQTRRLA